ncbi:MAG TPA: methyltransferase domain-containing protein [Pseudonocardiaceae bacterium]
MGHEAYDEAGAAYARHTATNSCNAYYDRPAVLALAGDVAGLDVLDAGCAAGYLSGELADRGARVTGLDASAVMLDLARERLGPEVRLVLADLAEPLDLPSSAFDLVTASLVLHYLEDWGPPLRELHRVLRPGGALVMSVHHPGEDWRWFDRPDYFVTERLTDSWPIDGGRRMTVRFWRRPLSACFDALRDAGFTVDRLVEPRPLPEGEALDPGFYPLLLTRPRFLYFRCLR